MTDLNGHHRDERFGHLYLLREAGDGSAERHESGACTPPPDPAPRRSVSDTLMFLAVLAVVLIDAACTVAHAHLTEWIRRVRTPRS